MAADRVLATAALRSSLSVALIAAALPAGAGSLPVHGLWVWNSTQVLQAPQGAPALRDFCQSAGINEVYVSVSRDYSALEELRLTQLIALLHQIDIRVDALIYSVDGDEVGAPRTALLDRVQSILNFDHHHPAQHFDGIHLAIEPQRRPEYESATNNQFLPALVVTYRAVRARTDRAALSLGADIPSKVLAADVDERRALLSAVPRLTLLMDAGTIQRGAATPGQRLEQLRRRSRRYLQMAYRGVDEPHAAGMLIALRAQDHEAQLPPLLAALDDANRSDPHYLGWARSYDAAP
ncbi:MAG TPA: hypothetical protein VIX87_00400 [Steroidobacteraceae bacterium]